MFNSWQFGNATGFIGPNDRVYQIDSKAMRKVDVGQDVVAVVESAGIGAGFTLVQYMRTLVKLH